MYQEEQTIHRCTRRSKHFINVPGGANTTESSLDEPDLLSSAFPLPVLPAAFASFFASFFFSFFRSFFSFFSRFLSFFLFPPRRFRV